MDFFKELNSTASDIESFNLSQIKHRPQRLSVVHPLQFLWSEFLSEVCSTMLLGKVSYLKEKGLLRREEVILIAAGADRAGNRFLWEDACCGKELSEFCEKDSGQVNKRRVTEAAIGICIAAGLEDFCCGLAENSPYEVSLWVIHRAGESGFLRFLLTLAQRKIRVKTNKIIESMPWKVHMKLERKSRNKWPRFPANKPYLEFCDVLKWACLTQTEEKIRELIKGTTEIEDAAVASVLISEGYLSLLEQLIDQKVFRMTMSGMLVLLEHECFCLAFKILKVTSIQNSLPIISFKTPALLRDEEIIQKLISQIRNNSGVVVLHILAMVHRDDWHFSEVSNLYNAVKELITAEDLESNPLVNSWNPLLFAITASEICEKVGTFSLQYRSCFTLLSKELRTVAMKIQNQYLEYRDLRKLYAEPIFDGTCLFDVMTQNSEKYRDLLNNTVVMSVIEDLWAGGSNIPFRLSPITPSTWYFDSFESPQSMFTAHSSFVPDLSMQSLFQVHYWKANGTLRFFIETFGALTLYGLLCASLVLYIRAMNIMESGSANMSDIEEATNEMDFIRSLTTFYIVISGSYMLGTMQRLLYKRLLKESFKIGLKEFLDSVMLACSLTIRLLAIDSIFNSIQFSEIVAIVEPLYALLFFACGLRICSVLLQLHSFGPVLRMIYVIVKDVSSLLLIFLLALVSFGVLFSPLFRKNEMYFGELQVSVRTLFQWSLGGIDYTVFTEREELGSILGSIWTVLSAIIILNILIAVLSSRYEELSKQVTADYVSILYSSYKDTRYEKPFGALILAPAPFNLLMLPLFPLFLLFPNHIPRINEVFVIVSYQVLFMCGTFAWMLYVTAMNIFVYFLVIVRTVSKVKGREMLWLAAWVFAGPFYLMYLTVLSLSYFCRNCYRDSDQQSERDLPADVLTPLKRFVEVANNSGITYVTMSEIRSLLTVLPRQKFFDSSYDSISTLSTLKKSSIFYRMATKVYFSKAKMRNEIAIRIMDLMMKFRSYNPDNDDEEQRVNLARFGWFLKKFEGKTNLLSALNVYFVQKAVYSRSKERKSDNELNLY